MTNAEEPRYCIRPATCADVPVIARVHVDSWRTTYPGILPDEFLANLSYERREVTWRRDLCDEPDPRELILVVEDASGEIVGFASGGPEHDNNPDYVGELYRLYLLAAHQRQGLGRRLVSAIAEHLVAQGLPSMMLWVMADNPARAFYEGLGGVLLRVRTWEVMGKPLGVAAYGWPDARVLLNGAAERQS
jgi:ribosomal protein S18 acetylase RimI-like enzyme